MARCCLAIDDRERQTFQDTKAHVGLPVSRVFGFDFKKVKKTNGEPDDRRNPSRVEGVVGWFGVWPQARTRG
jgi:hypothetical protein